MTVSMTDGFIFGDERQGFEIRKRSHFPNL